MSTKRITLRVNNNLHTAWNKDANSQGLSLNSYLTTCIQSDRVRSKNEFDPMQLDQFTRQLEDVQVSNKEVTAKLNEVLRIVESKVYDSVDLDRAREAILNILLNPNNVEEIKTLTTRAKLTEFILGKNSLLERYMIPHPQNPMTILDEIIFELEANYYIKVEKDDTLTWSFTLWEERENIKELFCQK